MYRLKSALLGACVAMLSAVSFTAASAATVYNATSADADPTWANYGGGHSLVLAGVSYFFDTSGRFTDNGSTASLTGTVLNGDGTAGYNVNLNFNLFTSTPPVPKLELKDSAYSANGGPVDPSTWKLWDMVESGTMKSTFEGILGNSGLDFDVISKPVSEMFAFQSGIGANGKNIKNGLSGWLYLVATGSQGFNPCPARTATQEMAGDKGNVCDFNLDILTTTRNTQVVPLPAPGLLLIVGIASMVGVSRLRASHS